MPYVLSESIHYNPTDTKEAIDYIRQFALSVGWTVDTWVTGEPTQLQLWSPGYVAQELCYRIQVVDVDAQEQTLSLKGVVPGYRSTSFSVTDSVSTWGGNSTSYYNTSLTASFFDALYLYGNKHFICAIFHVDPIAVITLQIGSWDLYPSWWYYSPGINFVYNPQDNWGSSSTYKWYNMTSNPTRWAPPMSQRWSISLGSNVWYEGAKRGSSDYACNYRPAADISLGLEAGEFNRAKGILTYNSYTAKRMAFQSSFFVRNPSLGIWYPVGVSPFAWINGRNLTIGEVVKFGADEYRCFPGVFSTYEHWQAYRIA
ncbi:MAG: hypothetical protein PVG39_00220 [Desulfobacteraceae bacterium]|jgi:hypothetical protein